MPTLNWIGKENVTNIHDDKPLWKLERKYTFPPECESENMIIHGDNLEALKVLLPQFENHIKCIYIDPPYNTGNVRWMYNDQVSHDKWLCMMYPRLKLMQKFLSNDGAIFISIDDNEHPYLKLICDDIFGEENFVGNIVWQKKFLPQNKPEWFSDIIVCYAKNKAVWYPRLLEKNDIATLSKWLHDIEYVPSAKYELKTIFYEKEKLFETPKPSALIERILQLATDKSSIILDSFAGSGSTAHAVLNYNKQDGGSRRFILVEMEDYAETITAERVRRVITGYGNCINAVDGVGGDFSYYEIGN